MDDAHTRNHNLDLLLPKCEVSSPIQIQGKYRRHAEQYILPEIKHPPRMPPRHLPESKQWIPEKSIFCPFRQKL